VSNSYHVRLVHTDGSTNSSTAYAGSIGVRPACNLKISYLVSRGSKRTKDNDSGFPVFNSTRAENDYQCIAPGMTLTKYAAIKLKVPRSGDPDIDMMIRESRRADFAERALGQLAACVIWERENEYERAAKVAFGMADAMLAEWNKNDA
jgi:hypothetical protein